MSVSEYLFVLLMCLLTLFALSVCELLSNLESLLRAFIPRHVLFITMSDILLSRA